MTTINGLVDDLRALARNAKLQSEADLINTSIDRLWRLDQMVREAHHLVLAEHDPEPSAAFIRRRWLADARAMDCDLPPKYLRPPPA
jgi:hypothetical protein